MGYSDQGNQRFCKLLNPKLETTLLGSVKSVELNLG
jgi:hypothetical protein